MAEVYSYQDNYRGDDGLSFPIHCTEPSPHSITRYIQQLHSSFNTYNANRLAYNEDNQSNSIANQLLPKTLLDSVNVEGLEMRDYIESSLSTYNTIWGPNPLANDEDNQRNSIANQLLPKTLLDSFNVESLEMRDYIEESERNADHPTSIDTWFQENPLAENVSGPGDYDDAMTTLDYYRKTQKRIRSFSDSAPGSSMGSASTRSGTYNVLSRNTDQQSVLWKRAVV